MNCEQGLKAELKCQCFEKRVFVGKMKVTERQKSCTRIFDDDVFFTVQIGEKKG